MRLKKTIVLIGFVVSLSGCAKIVDFPKVLWGSSTAALERARSNAISKTYYCNFDDCFDAILSLGRNQKKYKPLTEKFFDIFIKDRVKSHIVVMGIEGNVDTTEVGIFFSRGGVNAYSIEVTSLSSTAKRKVAEAIFNELKMRFKEKEVN